MTSARGPEFNIEGNRRQSKWTHRELLGRLLWGFCAPLFKFSPKLMWSWRNSLLRIFGARIGRHVQIHPSVKIFIPWNLEVGEWSSIGFDALVYNLGMVKIGQRVTISQRSHLCAGTHDHRDPGMRLLKLPITIKNDVWVCADAFIGPNVEVGNYAIIGAGAVVVRSVTSSEIVAGNPAIKIGTRTKQVL